MTWNTKESQGTYIGHCEFCRRETRGELMRGDFCNQYLCYNCAVVNDVKDPNEITAGGVFYYWEE